MQPTFPTDGPAAPSVCLASAAATRPSLRSAASCSSLRPWRTSTPGGAGSGPWVQPSESPLGPFTSKTPSQADPFRPRLRPVYTRPRVGDGEAICARRGSTSADAAGVAGGSTGIPPPIVAAARTPAKASPRVLLCNIVPSCLVRIGPSAVPPVSAPGAPRRAAGLHGCPVIGRDASSGAVRAEGTTPAG